MASVPQPPAAKRVPATRTVHGDTVVDDYAWLRDRQDPDTLAYLEAENAYCQAMTAHLQPLQERIFQEIKARTQETDLSAPARQGAWWYYTRTEEGKQYPLHCRRRSEADDGSEQLLLDLNELAGSSPFFALGHFLVSPHGRLLAFSTNYDGSESYTLRFKDLDSGETLPDEISGVYYGGAWSADGTRFFYVTHDAAMRPYRVWRHRVGTPSSDDTLLHEEGDERFFADVSLTRSQRFVLLGLHSKVTSEVWYLSAEEPDSAPQIVVPRRQGVEYQVDHQGDRFLILHNDGAPSFALASTPVAQPSPEHWQTVISPSDETRLDSVHAFADHLVVHLRHDGRTGLRILPVMAGVAGEPHDVAFPEPVYTVWPGDNREYDTPLFRLAYTSFVTPRSIYDYDVRTRTLTLKKQQPVLGDYDPAAYASAREWATAADGTRVPISLVWRQGTPRDGSTPCLLAGYGSYESSNDPAFSIPRLSLLDRGFVCAIAHVRGGGELGRRWYEDGKLLNKRNTFTDFIACADHLVQTGWTSSARLVARGGSAGGLLMGAVANMAPALFRAIVAHVPFVDALNTILDPTLPLTVIEWEEWGNPLVNHAVYRYMQSYAPYENVAAQAYPALLVTAGLNDPRVGYHEPAKWVARLRATKTDSNPLLLKTEMGAGHGGKSGRYDAWREEAFILAFIVDVIDAGSAPARVNGERSPLVGDVGEDELRTQWQAAHAQSFTGWDFSVFGDRRVTLPRVPAWDYTESVLAAIDHAQRMLDMDTGGGEQLADLHRWPPLTVATEGYPPNVALAHERLAPLGVGVVEVRDAKRLPFRDGQFDLVTNRHGRYAAADVSRVLRPGGTFITQQVGEQTNRRLHELLGDPTPFRYSSLAWTLQKIEAAGLRILERREEFLTERYADVAAIVYYLKAVPWEVPDFDVDRYFDKLLAMHALVEAEGHLDVGFHQLFVVARKPSG